MSTSIGNVEIKGLKKGKPKLKGDYYQLAFYQTKSSLQNLEKYNKFINSVKSLVRKNEKYKRYIAYLKDERGLNFCQIHPNIIDEDEKSHLIEMHHGPILTLHDYCSIITNALLERKEKITTFKVASIVLEEHFNHNVQVVMLCENCHDLFHAGNYIYINPRQAHGNLERFLKKWSDGIDDDMRELMNKNLEIARKFHSTDNDMLDASSGKAWGKIV